MNYKPQIIHIDMSMFTESEAERMRLFMNDYLQGRAEIIPSISSDYIYCDNMNWDVCDAFNRGKEFISRDIFQTKEYQLKLTKGKIK